MVHKMNFTQSNECSRRISTLNSGEGKCPRALAENFFFNENLRARFITYLTNMEALKQHLLPVLTSAILTATGLAIWQSTKRFIPKEKQRGTFKR